MRLAQTGQMWRIDKNCCRSRFHTVQYKIFERYTERPVETELYQLTTGLAAHIRRQRSTSGDMCRNYRYKSLGTSDSRCTDSAYWSNIPHIENETNTANRDSK